VPRAAEAILGRPARWLDGYHGRQKRPGIVGHSADDRESTAAPENEHLPEAAKEDGK
jgi:hypothetical protein